MHIVIVDNKLQRACMLLKKEAYTDEVNDCYASIYEYNQCKKHYDLLLLILNCNIKICIHILCENCHFFNIQFAGIIPRNEGRY